VGVALGAQATAARIADVEAHSARLRKELGLVSLVLTQVMYVVGSAWVGTAAKLGPSHVVFWSLAILLFYLPQAAVVIYLNRRMPLEGGLYQWATVGLGDFWGFLTAWYLWAYTILIIGVFGVVIATNVSYLIGPLGASFVHAPWYTPVVSALAVIALTIVSLFGLKVSKWLQGLGGASQFLTYLALIAALVLAVSRRTPASTQALRVAMPSVTLYSLNIFGKMALGALSGFEYVAILAGECRDPARTVGRSVLVAVPIIAAMFILGTTSVLAIVPQDQIDLVSPIPQTLTMGLQRSRRWPHHRADADPVPADASVWQRRADLRGEHAAAHGRRLGPPGPEVVLEAASTIPDAAPLHLLRRRYHAGPDPGRADRRRPAGGIPAAGERRRASSMRSPTSPCSRFRSSARVVWARARPSGCSWPRQRDSSSRCSTRCCRSFPSSMCGTRASSRARSCSHSSAQPSSVSRFTAPARIRQNPSQPDVILR
jgi:hypothetical protein